jgi:hypothetical protein
LDFHIHSDNLSVRGEIAGAADYVLRPTPASGTGAAGRLRARAFRVEALRDLVRSEAEKRCQGPNAERDLAAYQAELDQWALAECRGELVFHLAPDAKIAARRGHPLEGALVSGARWNAAAFRGSWGVSGTIQCSGCGATAADANGGVCVRCVEDDELGGLLATAEHVTISAPGHRAIEVGVKHRYAPLNFDGLLGYLAVALEGAYDASQHSDVFSFPMDRGRQILIGPWDRVLRLAISLQPQSAGLVLAAPQANMRSAVRRAQHELARAGAGHFSLDGQMLEWKAAAQVVDRAFEMAGWLKEDRMTSSTLRRIGELHRMSQNGGPRYLPLLVWQGRDADRLMRRKILRLAADRAQWQSTDLVTELAFLAANAANSSGGRNG